MNHNQADKLITDHGDYLTATEVNVFRSVLAKADFRDCSVPAFVTPRLAKLASGCRISERTARRALTHLDRHGWLSYQPGNGRGHRAKFQLVPRVPDAKCGCPRKGDTSDPFSGDKGGHQRPIKGDSGDAVVPAQSAFCTKGRGRGEVEGTAALQPSRDHYVSLPAPVAVPEPDPQLGPDPSSNVVPIRRKTFASLSSPRADYLWSLAHDS